MEFTLEERALLAPLFDVLPPDAAMAALLPRHAAAPAALAAVRGIAASEALRDNPGAQAALWLYVDALDASHSISQGLHDATGSFLHGIMHRREGDFGNSHYWMRRAGSHPVWQVLSGYDPDKFIDAVAAARGADPGDLVALQRAEWQAVMAHCLRRGR